MAEWVGEEWRWNLEWRRPRFRWEWSLLTNFLQDQSQDDVFKLIWPSMVPSKIGAFGWRLIQNRL